MERIGDLRWLELLREHNAIVRQEAGTCARLLKPLGDGFMLVFSDPGDAIRAAIAIQRRLAAHDEAGAGERIRVRMGAHAGEAIEEAGDFYGRTVNTAARIAAGAAAGEILVSSALRELVEPAGTRLFCGARPVELRGLGGMHVVHSLDWARGDGRSPQMNGHRARPAPLAPEMNVVPGFVTPCQ